MKRIMIKSLIAFTVLWLNFPAWAQNPSEPAPDNTPLPTSGTDTNAADQPEVPGELIQAVVDAQQAMEGNAADTNAPPTDPQAPRSIRGQGSRGTMGSGTNAQSLASFLAHSSTNHLAGGGKTLRLNFRNAPLSLVLDYLSDAAGFTISANSKVDLKGTVTVWSNQPVERGQAVQLLHKALSEHSYAANVEGNVLNIYVIDASNTDIVAGVPNNDYTNIPPTKDLVTQIVYVRNVETGPLITSLQPLMPAGTTMSANQGANAIVITDTKANIRRMVQLVKALDTASVSASKVAVFPLTYADATALAQVVTQLFQQDTAGNQQGGRGGGLGRMLGGFNPFGGGGGGGGGTPAQQGRVAAAKVTAVADERSNSLVVSASEDQMLLVRELVDQMDVNVDQVTELKVFRLRYADPQEIADQLASLFPDPTTQQSSRGQFRGFGPFGGFGGGNASTASQSTRKLSQTKVTAVPDPRTGSVIVSASRDFMPQIAGIIEELDSDPAKKKKVHVIKVENRDPQEVVEDLQSVIAADTSGGNFSNTRSTSQQSGSQLNSRQQNNLRNQGNNSGSFNLNSGGTGGSRTGR